ncbi:MAG TPA: GAF domain-containing protein [Coleofasciculaceae cyanobacterium]
MKNEFLQACLTIQEAETALTDLLQPLFPNAHGAVYLMNNSKNLFQAIAVWGVSNSNISFEPNECWSLRRGNSHISHPHTSGLYCSHVDCQTNLTPTLCLPMIAKGETLGMLYLSFSDSATINKSIQDLAETVAQNIAMSFANLKLQEKLRYQSLRDPLTGLYNRRYLRECLTKEIDRSQRKQQFIGN